MGCLRILSDKAEICFVRDFLDLSLFVILKNLKIQISVDTIFVLTESPGTSSVKFNIPKRPYQVQCSPVSNQAFPPGEQPSGLNLPPSSLATASAAPGASLTR